MSLPIEAIDRLFQRLSGAYMAAWDRHLGNSPLNDVKSAWAAELAEFGRSRESLGRVAWALENLPDRPPSAPEFKRLCRSAPAPEAPRLEESRSDPARVAAELAKLGPLRASVKSAPIGGKDWAHRLIKRHEAGEKLNMTVLQMAKQALRIQPSMEAA